MGDLWHWRVTYGDGSTLDEYDPDGKDHGWAEVNIRRVALVTLVPQYDGLPVHMMKVDGAWIPGFLRRRYIGVPQDGSEGTRATVHVLTMGTVYLFLFEDGRSLLTDDFNAV